MRDALHSLLADQVIARNSKRQAEIIEFRSLLEPEIAALAARNADEKDLARLDAILNAQAPDQESDATGDGEADQRFHLALARATKNEVIRETVAVLHDLLRESRVPPLQSPERKRLSLQGHGRILAALQARDPDAAREAMRAHLKDIESAALKR